MQPSVAHVSADHTAVMRVLTEAFKLDLMHEESVCARQAAELRCTGLSWATKQRRCHSSSRRAHGWRHPTAMMRRLCTSHPGSACSHPEHSRESENLSSESDLWPLSWQPL